MSAPQQPNPPDKQQQPSPVIKQKKSKRDTNRKKKASSTQIEQTNLMKKPQEKQLRLQKYMKKMKKDATNSNEATNTNSEDFLSITCNKTLLEDEIKKKTELIQTLNAENRNQQQKNAKSKSEFKQYCQITKRAIVESKKQIAAIRRRQMGEINFKFGYFRDVSCSSFVEGAYLTDFKTKISKSEFLLIDLQAQKNIISQEEKYLLTSKIQFLKKQLSQMKAQIQIRQKQVNNYKQQLRFYIKSQDRTYSKDNWPLLKNCYQPLYFIGSGGFAEVYQGYDVERYQDVAIKIHNLDRSPPQFHQQLVKHLKRQIMIHKQLEHPNIVKMIDQLDLDGKIGIVMEYCSGPELKAYLKKEGCLDEREAKFIIKQLIYAVKYLHEQKYSTHEQVFCVNDKKFSVIHYDLKPANVLFHNGTIKIVDFGISKIMEGEQSCIDLTSPKAGTYYYLPPQVFEENTYKISNKVDVWSIGVIFYELLYGRKPFGNGLSQQKILMTCEIPKAARGLEFPSSSPKNYKISDQAKTFIRKCLEYDPDRRINSLQAYEDEYIN